LEFNRYHFQYRVGVAQHIVVPKSQHFVALRSKPCRPSLVMARHCCHPMLATIKLYDQSGIVADEVYDVSADRSLPPKARAAKSMCAQEIPESLLSLAHRAAKPFG
jgi:hypothetical protein